ncbi:hypothetical protein [Streptomyces chryseus]|uniref:hypothetical protein n=1 Tax=Streptomyces chryseus TaxID=68186 RepID=UPI00110F861B|nr:hypothetical protein [Streptomyces chryseus]GGX42932.1 hypothetical protein GCM10010353_67600 [Streptomyces chryseus]
MTVDPLPAARRTVRQALGFSDATWRRYTAIHEAGHAIAAMRDEDAALIQSSLGDTTTTDGRASVAGFTELSWTSARGIAVVLYAGLLAQERWLRELNLATPHRLAATAAAATHDFEHLAAYDLSPAQLRTVRTDTARLRDDHWPALLAVADILDTQGTVTTAEASAAAAQSRATAQGTPGPTLIGPQDLLRLDTIARWLCMRERSAF